MFLNFCVSIVILLLLVWSKVVIEKCSFVNLVCVCSLKYLLLMVNRFLIVFIFCVFCWFIFLKNVFKLLKFFLGCDDKMVFVLERLSFLMSEFKIIVFFVGSVFILIVMSLLFGIIYMNGSIFFIISGLKFFIKCSLDGEVK